MTTFLSLAEHNHNEYTQFTVEFSSWACNMKRLGH